MNEKSDHEDLEKDIRFRTRIYNSLARDSLVILTIQLFVVPLLISAATLIFRLLNSYPSSNKESAAKQLQSAINSVAVFEGLIVLSSAVILTTATYYDARRRSTKQPKLITKINTNNYSNQQSIGSVHRAILLISLILSFYTLYIVSTQLLSVLSGSISGLTRSILGAALFITFLIVVYSPIVAQFEDLIEFMFGLCKSLLMAGIDLTESGFLSLLDILWIQITDGDLKINLLISFIMLVSGANQLPAGFSRSIYTTLIILGEFTGVSAIYFFILNKLK